MKTYIVPDVHERLATLQRIVKAIPTDAEIAFLGDFFDSFNLKVAAEMAQWVKDNVQNPRYTFIIGNHDAHYFFPNDKFKCSGFTPYKDAVINSILEQEDKRQFLISVERDGWTLSHAGFRPETADWLHPENQEFALDAAFTGNFHPLWAAGRARSGNEPFGGPTWLDWFHEFKPVRGLKQIVGHTDHNTVRRSKQAPDNWCIDTGLRHVGILEEGNFSYMTVDELLEKEKAPHQPG
mgnify:CR=1 FL=1